MYRTCGYYNITINEAKIVIVYCIIASKNFISNKYKSSPKL